MGYVPEAETPLEDFRAEALKCYDVTLDRVAGIHRVGTSACGGKGVIGVLCGAFRDFPSFYLAPFMAPKRQQVGYACLLVIALRAEGYRMVGPDNTWSMCSLGLLLGPSTLMYPSLHCRGPAAKRASGNHDALVVSRFGFHRYNVS